MFHGLEKGFCGGKDSWVLFLLTQCLALATIRGSGYDIYILGEL